MFSNFEIKGLYCAMTLTRSSQKNNVSQENNVTIDSFEQIDRPIELIPDSHLEDYYGK